MTMFRRSAGAMSLVGAGLPLTAAFFFWGCSNSYRSFPSSLTTSLLASSATSVTRTRNTIADKFFQEHGELPLPSVMHATLPPRIGESMSSERRKGILVVGDVHGCFKTLTRLHEKAINENGGTDFEHVILVGDLVNKGADSARVIRFVRTQENWLSVRGNHDDGALAAALGDVVRRKKQKYRWVMEGEEDDEDINQEESEDGFGVCTSRFEGDEEEVTLSDDDVLWLSELPYTITIPSSYFGDTVDTLIVHGGLIPGLELELQTIDTMITIREVSPVSQQGGKVVGFEFHVPQRGKVAISSDDEVSRIPRPWASVWNGPMRVIFGHDARRGLQREDMAIGLDTGAVYGNELTGIILPERKIVSIESQEDHPAPVGG